MSYNFIALKVTDFPLTTMFDENPDTQRFNDNRTKFLFCYLANKGKKLVHNMDDLKKLSPDITSVGDFMSRINPHPEIYTAEELRVLTNDINSEWYLPPEVDS